MLEGFRDKLMTRIIKQEFIHMDNVSNRKSLFQTAKHVQLKHK